MIASVVLLILVPLLFPGVVRKVRARAQRRQGPPWLQPWRDFSRLIVKSPIDGPYSGFFAEVAPIASAFAGLALWSLVVWQWAPLLVGLFFLILQMLAITGYGQETGTSFGGLGASREFVLAMLAKPTMVLFLAALGTQGYFEVHGLLGLGIVLAFLFSTFLAILAETARPPFDDPRTHLELTMVHEAMLLEASGRSMALFSLGAVLKDCALVTLVSRAFIGTIAHLFGWNLIVPMPILVALTSLVMAVILGYWESISVRRRWNSIPETLGLSFLLTLFFGALLLGLGGEL